MCIITNDRQNKLNTGGKKTMVNKIKATNVSIGKRKRGRPRKNPLPPQPTQGKLFPDQEKKSVPVSDDTVLINTDQGIKIV